ncbi:MAG: hypothetical protein Q4D16_14140 [Eubacteriales bacterium]|nr:hypothetical protein [Eubacteriales bacterium]
MEKMSKKKWLCGLMALVCVNMGMVPAMAETVSFSITVPGEAVRIRGVKDNNDQKFYIRGASFNKDGILRCMVYDSNGRGISAVAEISKDKPEASVSYRNYAVAGSYYYIYFTSSTNGLQVTGRYRL